MINTKIHVRDPYILEHNGVYYMYGTGIASDYGCRRSTDLVNWSEPVSIYKFPPHAEAAGQFWAPECHFYNGSFYLFASYNCAKNNHRGSAVFKCGTPDGEFEMITDGHFTPRNWDSIDATLHVDEDGQPWSVFVHEWTCMPDHVGTMAAAKLSPELTRLVSEPVTLFSARSPSWARGGVTDGPFLYRMKSTGTLLMLWSNSCDSGYCVGIAKSSNGKLTGEWSQRDELLYRRDSRHQFDGGHGMLFEHGGKLWLSIHSPNGSIDNITAAAVFYEVREDSERDTLVLAE